MGEMITKPDANPILYAVLNIIVCGIPIGHFMMGQTSKAVIILVYAVLLNMFGIGWIISILAAVDAYKLGEKLKNGESIGQKENGFELFNSLPGLN
ncbi:MAG: hypothetical protein EA397_06395 [Deltaproteobacteria bacterium]|nr:MAG: hypothetical protein EA397_06395 [Deltaproteobacteria bacterium]